MSNNHDLIDFQISHYKIPKKIYITVIFLFNLVNKYIFNDFYNIYYIFFII